jgi:hypothetical protein
LQGWLLGLTGCLFPSIFHAVAHHHRYGMPTGNDEADLWHRTTGLAGGQQTQLPYFSIAAEMYRGFTDMGEALQELGAVGVAGRPDMVAEGVTMVTEAQSLYNDLQTSLRRTAAAAVGAPSSLVASPASADGAAGGAATATGLTPSCPISFVAGGTNCSVADPSQSTHLQSRENEPWRTYAELMYSGTFPRELTEKYLSFASKYEMGMKVGMLAGTGPSCCGKQLMTFTSHGYGFGLLQHGLVARYLLLLYTATQHACTRGTWVCGESSSIDRNENTIDYATPAQLTVPLLLKWALLFDEPVNRTLWVTPAAPREWLAPNLSINLANGPSRYGRITLAVNVPQPLKVHINITIRSGSAGAGAGAGEGAGVDALAFRTVPTGGVAMRVRVPTPAGAPFTPTPRIRTVTVGGVRLPQRLLTPEDDVVRIPATMLVSSSMLTDLQSIVVTLK